MQGKCISCDTSFAGTAQHMCTCNSIAEQSKAQAMHSSVQQGTAQHQGQHIHVT